MQKFPPCLVEHLFGKVLSLRDANCELISKIFKSEALILQSLPAAGASTAAHKALAQRTKSKAPRLATSASHTFQLKEQENFSLARLSFHAAADLTQPGALEKAQETVTGMPETFLKET